MIGRLGMIDEEVLLLQQTVAKSVIHIEIGCLWGLSAIAAAKGGAQIVFTIDPMKGGWWDTADPAVNLRPFRADVEKNFAEAGMTNRIHIIQARSSPWPLTDIRPDTILIDGDHSFEGATTDWQNASKYAKRAILVHDYNETHPGVKQMVEQYALLSLDWIFSQKAGSLAVFTRRDVLPLVTAIIPTYSRPESLERALNSFEQQGYGNKTAVVINDGGCDVSNVIKKFDNVRYFEHGCNWGGPANARNTGLRLAKGELVAYLDDDDRWLPDHLSVLIAKMIAAKARFVYSDALVHNTGRQPELWFSREFSKQGILSKNVTATCCVIHERELLRECGFFDPTLSNHEDWDLWIRFSRATDLVHVSQATAVVDRTGLGKLKLDELDARTKSLKDGFNTVYKRYEEWRKKP